LAFCERVKGDLLVENRDREPSPLAEVVGVSFHGCAARKMTVDRMRVYINDRVKGRMLELTVTTISGDWQFQDLKDNTNEVRCRV
jgi:hypothetical protein